MDGFDFNAEPLAQESSSGDDGFAESHAILVNSDSDDDSDGNSGSSEESELDEDELAFARHHLIEWEAMESDDETSEFSEKTDPDNYTEYSVSDDDNEEGMGTNSRDDNTSGGGGKHGRGAGLAAFPLFTQLPAELRLRIWELHCPDLLEQVRVFEMRLERGGRLAMGQSMIRKGRPLRRFMRICQETRARGLQTVPDELPLGVYGRDSGVHRFHAQSDILHFNFEETGAIPRTGLYDNVRNIAMFDMEVRSRGPGVYHDYVHGHIVLGIMSEEDVSHQRPSELRPAEFSEALEKAFPQLENLYVVEKGIVQYLDRWVGADDHETYEINTYERDESGRRLPLRLIYCWHAPPPKRRISSGQTGAHGEEKCEEGYKEEAVLNHVSALKERGVRFSRMLLYEDEEGCEVLLEMRTLCEGGKWPVAGDGKPRVDDPPYYGDEWIGSVDDEYESEGIDDEDSEDSEEEDSDDGEDVQALEANFSSPEPELEPEPRTSRQGKRRRVLSDSDDSDSETNGGKAASNASQVRAKRQRRLVVSDDEDSQVEGEKKKQDEDAEDDEDEDSKSSETEVGQDAKKLSLAERLQLNRLNNPISSDEDESDSASDSEVDGSAYGALVEMLAKEGDESESESESEGEGSGRWEEGEWGGIDESGEEDDED